MSSVEERTVFIAGFDGTTPPNSTSFRERERERERERDRETEIL
jgi:hypothetical protein